MVALDVDGVLIDPMRGDAGHWQETVGPVFGLEPGVLKPFFAGPWAAVVTGRVAVGAALAEFFAADGHDVDTEAFIAAWLAADCVVNEPVVEIAAAWARAGASIVLATNQEHRRAERVRAALAPRLDLLDVLYSADLGVTKPSPEFFALADTRIASRVENHRVVFIDDSLGNVEAARAFGWSAVHYDGHPHWQAEVDHAIANG